MRSVLKTILVGLVAVLAGCATGPKFAEVANSFPPIPAGEGRVFFYRDSMMGAAFSPDVRVDSRVIAPMKANSFFFVDLPAGRHTASASTEVDANLDFTANAGEATYINVTLGIGLVVGRPHLTLRSASEANQAISGLAYAGSHPLSAGSAATSRGDSKPPAAGGTPAGKAPAPRQSQGGVSMDDLRGLLPASR